MIQDTSQLLIIRTDCWEGNHIIANINNDILMAGQVDDIDCSVENFGNKFKWKKNIIDELKLFDGA